MATLQFSELYINKIFAALVFQWLYWFFSTTWFKDVIYHFILWIYIGWYFSCICARLWLMMDFVINCEWGCCCVVNITAALAISKRGKDWLQNVIIVFSCIVFFHSSCFLYWLTCNSFATGLSLSFQKCCFKGKVDFWELSWEEMPFSIFSGHSQVLFLVTGF